MIDPWSPGDLGPRFWDHRGLPCLCMKKGEENDPKIHIRLSNVKSGVFVCGGITFVLQIHARNQKTKLGSWLIP